MKGVRVYNDWWLIHSDLIQTDLSVHFPYPQANNNNSFLTQWF